MHSVVSNISTAQIFAILCGSMKIKFNEYKNSITQSTTDVGI